MRADRKAVFRLAFLFGIMLLAFQSSAQRGLFVNDSSGGFCVFPKGSIYVDGDFQVLNITEIQTLRLVNGHIYVTGDFVTDKVVRFDRRTNLNGTSAGLHFVGNGDSHIRGFVSPILYQLHIAKTSGDVYIDNDLTIVDTISFTSGNAIIDPSKIVTLDYRQGSITSPSNPWIAGESAQHRFKGGILETYLELTAYHPANIANTGFYLYNHQSDTMKLIRGHDKQLYAGNGGVDWYFDFDLWGDDADSRDTLGMSYLHDVNFAIAGVDTSRLGLYVSQQFADVDFRLLKTERTIMGVDYSVIDTAAFSDPTLNVSSKHFRITAGDTACILPPLSNLPPTEIHLCAGDSLLVTAENTVAYSFPNSVRYFWKSDSLNVPSRYVSATGSQQTLIVKLTDSRGCYSYDTLVVAPVAPDPIVSFTWADACLGDSVYVSDQTTIASGSFTSTWNFGNGATSALAADTLGILYAASGSYTVTLTSVSNYGCEAAVSNVIDVFNLPVANIQTSVDCFNHSVFVNGAGSTGTTSPASYAITSYNWRIDGSPASTASSFYAPVLAPGTHQFELVVVSGVFCHDTLVAPFIIDVSDTAGFTVSSACAGSPVALVNTSFIANANPQFHWNFGDGTTSNAMNPVKTYATAGLFPIELIVETDAACADTFSTSILVTALPDAAFTTTGFCQGSAYTFQAATLSGTSNYSWNLSDGATLTGPLVMHTFASSGPQSAVLTVQNAQGCTAQSTQSFTVNPAPAASFLAAAVCQGTASTLISTSSGPGLTSSWNFGDFSAAGSGATVQHIYPASGTYNAVLTVTSSAGCSGTITQPVTVHQLPQLNLGTLPTCGSSYQLDAENPGSTYLWSPSNESTQTITVSSSGTYTVSVTNSNGCQSTGQANVTLNSIVQPNLGPDTAVCGEITFSAGYQGADFVWQDSSSLQTFTASTAGTYWVEVTDQNNCVGTDTVVVILVSPFVHPDLGAAMNVCSADFPVVVNAGSYNSYLWSNGSTNSSVSLPSQTSVWLEVVDANGCSGRDTLTVNSLESPVSTLVSTVSSCDDAVLAATSDPGNTFLWNTTETTNLINVTASGNYSVILTDIVSGCQTFDTVAVIVQPSPVVNLGPDISVCSNSPVTLNAANPGSTYQWTSSSNALLSTAPTYVPISSGTYLVTVSNGSCSTSDAVTLSMLPSPVIPAQAPTFYICGTTPVNLTGCAFAVNNWSGPNGFTSQAPVISSFETGSYSVIANVGACMASNSFILETSPSQLESFYLVDSDTTKNLALKFIDLSTPQPTTYLWDFGDGTSDTTASPVHQYSVVSIYYTSLTVSNGICISRFEKAINQKNFNPGTPESSAPNLELVDDAVYPNPSVDLVHFEVLLSDEASSEIVLYDVMGQILYRRNIADSKEIKLEIPLDELSTGSYFIRLNAESLKGNVVRNYKIIKSN